MNRHQACASVALLWIFSSQVFAANIVGTVYDDLNRDGLFSFNESVSGVTLQLVEDDGDGVFGLGDTALDIAVVTDRNGAYAFRDLDMSRGYFVLQPEQIVGAQMFESSLGQLIVPDGRNIQIDDFSASQIDVVTPLAVASSSIVNTTSVLGGQRDAFLQLLRGSAESKLRAKPYGLSDVLKFDESAGVSSRAVLTWDGVDDVADASAWTGLSGIDLTQGGLNTGFELAIGADAASDGNTLALRIYRGSSGDFSEATVPVPVTPGTETTRVLVPFDAFVGVVRPTSVDAIQLRFGGQATSVDLQIDYIGVSGPHVQNVSLTHAVPEPMGWGWWMLFLLLAGLGMRRRDSQANSAFGCSPVVDQA